MESRQVAIALAAGAAWLRISRSVLSGSEDRGSVKWWPARTVVASGESGQRGQFWHPSVTDTHALCVLVDGASESFRTRNRSNTLFKRHSARKCRFHLGVLKITFTRNHSAVFALKIHQARCALVRSPLFKLHHSKFGTQTGMSRLPTWPH